MADGNVDLTVITRTQESLGKYVKKPPLTEKLLKKPPFRFLHDLFNAIIKETGYFAGLYTADELNIDNIKDRDDKMRFLQKMIDLIQNVTQLPLTARPSKIVAGHEPEKTNELLQLMAQVIEKQLNWQASLPASSDAKDTKAKEKPKERESSKSKESKTKEVASKIPKDERAPLKKSTKESVTKEKEKRNGKEKVDRKERDKEKLRPSKEKPATTTTSTRMKKTLSQSSSSPEGAKRSKDSSISPKKPEKKHAPPIKEETKEIQRKAAKEDQEPRKKLSNDDEETTTRKPSKEKRDVTRKPSKEDDSPPLKEVEGVPSSQATSFNKTEMDPPKQDTKNLDVLDSSSELNVSRRTSAQERKGSGRKVSASKTTREEAALPLDVTSNAVEERHSPVEAKVMPAEVKAFREPDLPSLSKEMKRESTFVQNDNKNKESVAVANVNPNTARPRTSLRPPSARPASARPGAPRRRDKNVEIILQPNDQVKMSGISVKLESFGDLDDDGENLVIIEQANADTILMGMNGGVADGTARPAGDTTQLGADDEHQQQQGHLVQQIIETQKQLTQQSASDEKETESRAGSSVSGRQSSARQMNTLRDVIQNLTKSVHPFAKLMDFIPEDIDAMQLEMTMWRDTYTQASSELKRERCLTETATEPMKNQLVQIEANIKEYIAMIDASRTKVQQNSEKILKMLTEQ